MAIFSRYNPERITIKYQYRITKYNPKHRDKEQGHYLKDKWTSVSCIGEKFDDIILTEDEYNTIETAYTESIIIFMNENNINELQLIEYENNQNYKTDKLLIENENFYNKEQVKLLSRLILREEIWGKLVFDKQMFVHFGYDYYMYIGLEKKPKQALEIVEELGLFTEKFKSPYYVL